MLENDQTHMPINNTFSQLIADARLIRKILPSRKSSHIRAILPKRDLRLGD